MRIVNSGQFDPDNMRGPQPEIFYGTVVPDGDGAVDNINFKDAVQPSHVWRKVTDNHFQEWVKVKADTGGRNDDWVLSRGIICQRVLFSEFTDGGGTSGTKDLNATIPAGSVFERSLVTNITGFTGDTTATLILGVTGGDTDRYNTGTPSVFTTATAGVDLGAPSGTAWHTAAAVPTALVTSGSDFGLVVAGAMTITMFYRGSTL